MLLVQQLTSLPGVQMRWYVPGAQQDHLCATSQVQAAKADLGLKSHDLGEVICSSTEERQRSSSASSF